MPFWDFDDWRKEIDWMALNGINMPLALTGQEVVWNSVYQELGLSREELKEFFTGPAFFPWGWMGNLDGWGGPLPDRWFEMQKVLQRQILDAERRLGMTPVLPAFSGHVPESLSRKFPDADIKKGYKWSGFEGTFLLQPQDKLFRKIGSMYIRKQTELFGSDHLYSSDTFNENKPKRGTSLFLKKVSQSVYKSMADADPEAVWVMQGWLFLHDRAFWNNFRIKAMLNAVDNDKMIILDLFSTAKPVWNSTRTYFGKPWIYCMLHNWGGKQGMYGRLDKLAKEPADLLQRSDAGVLTGIGLTPEGLDTNPVVYDLFFDAVWSLKDCPAGFDLDESIDKYQKRRYGVDIPALSEAWSLLKDTLYKCPTLRHGPQGSLFCMRPSFSTNGSFVRADIWYDISKVRQAFSLMLNAVEQNKELSQNRSFLYDLADTGRQVMSDLSHELHAEIVKAVKSGNIQNFEKASADWITALDNVDSLLSGIYEFRLERWTDFALNRSSDDFLNKYFLFNAKNIITLWGPEGSTLHDYAQRQYSGMFSSFYKKRWEIFFRYCREAIQNQKLPDFKSFETECKKFEWEWCRNNFDGKLVEKNNTIDAARIIYDRWVSE
jgi:alpha-N-acetylglucosaminidase